MKQFLETGIGYDAAYVKEKDATGDFYIYNGVGIILEKNLYCNHNFLATGDF